MLSHLMLVVQGILYFAKLRLRFNQIRIHRYDKKANKTGKVRPKYEDKELRKASLIQINKKINKSVSMVTLVKSIVLYHLCIG